MRVGRAFCGLPSHIAWRCSTSLWAASRRRWASSLGGMCVGAGMGGELARLGLHSSGAAHGDGADSRLWDAGWQRVAQQCACEQPYLSLARGGANKDPTLRRRGCSRAPGSAEQDDGCFTARRLWLGSRHSRRKLTVWWGARPSASGGGGECTRQQRKVTLHLPPGLLACCLLASPEGRRKEMV